MKVLIVGLDGATLDLVRPWVDAGKLPHLASMMRQGVWGELQSTLPYITTTAWSSFATGLNPGKHGIFDFYQHRPGTQEIYFTNSCVRRGRTLWRRLSDRGHKVCVVNVPMTYPPESVNGILVSGMDTPDEHAQFTHPPDLREELSREAGRYIVDAHFDEITGGGRPRPEDYEAFFLRLQAMTEARCRAAEYLMGKQPWDLFVVVFVATDRSQHQFWQFMDPSHPRHDPGLSARFGDLILRTYQTCDDALGRLLARTDGDTNVMIMSDHGAGPSTRVFYVRRWLESAGYLVRRERRGGFRKEALVALKNVFVLAKRCLPAGVKRKLKTRLGRDNYLAVRLFLDVDWSRTRAYSEGVCGNIFINLKAREPHGTVEPGAEYDSLCREIEAGLMQVCDPQTGRPVVMRVHRPHTMYQGRLRTAAPDLLVEGFPECHCRGDCMTGEEGGAGPQLFADAPLSGSHKINGVFMACGPAFLQGHPVTGAQIADVCPTALHLLGEAVPSVMDGRVLEEAFTGEYRRTHPVRSVPEDEGSTGGPGSTETYSAEEKAMVADRLKGLGYLE